MAGSGVIQCRNAAQGFFKAGQKIRQILSRGLADLAKGHQLAGVGGAVQWGNADADGDGAALQRPGQGGVMARQCPEFGDQWGRKTAGVLQPLFGRLLVGLRPQNIDAKRGRPCVDDGRYQLGLNLAGPRPLAHPGQAGIVYRHDHNRVGVPVAAHQALIGIKQVEPRDTEQRGGKRLQQQEKGQHRPRGAPPPSTQDKACRRAHFSRQTSRTSPS